MKKTLAILEGCKKGNRNSQQLLYEQFHDFAMRIVFRYIYNYEDAIETVNDGFVKFFLNLDKLNLNDADNVDKMLGGWLKRIMINTAVDALRKKMMLPEIGGMPEHVWDIKDTAPDAEQKIIYKELILLVKKLPPSYRVVFNMHVIDGYKHIEIAEILGTPVGTLKSNLMRAKVLLRDFINQKESVLTCNN